MCSKLKNLSAAQLERLITKQLATSLNAREAATRVADVLAELSRRAALAQELIELKHNPCPPTDELAAAIAEVKSRTAHEPRRPEAKPAAVVLDFTGMDLPWKARVHVGVQTEREAGLPAVYVVKVHFRNSPAGKYYSYLSRDSAIKAGDVVIVESPYSGLTTVDVVQVERATPERHFMPGFNYRWIVSRATGHSPMQDKADAELAEAYRKEGQAQSAIAELRKLRSSNPAVAAILEKHNVKL